MDFFLFFNKKRVLTSSLGRHAFYLLLFFLIRKDISRLPREDVRGGFPRLPREDVRTLFLLKKINTSIKVISTSWIRVNLREMGF